jgi:hypothetical protein
MSVLLIITLGSILLIRLFVVGAYLLIRTGRSLSQRRLGGRPTEYVDAWSQYRLSEEQIQSALPEEPPGGEDQSNRDEGPPDGPANDPDQPHPAS